MKLYTTTANVVLLSNRVKPDVNYLHRKIHPNAESQVGCGFEEFMRIEDGTYVCAGCSRGSW